MTTTIVYAGEGGAVTSAASAYSNARLGTGTSSLGGTSGSQVGQQRASQYQVFQTFVGFDCSVIPATATVNAVNLEVCAQLDRSTAADFTIEARAYDYGGSVETTDFVPGTSLGADTLLASYSTAAGWPTNTYCSFTSQPALLTAVDASGIVRMVLASDRQRTGVAPVLSSDEYVYAYNYGQPGTTQDPRLTVTYTAAAADITGTAAVTVDATGTTNVQVQLVGGTAPVAVDATGAANVQVQLVGGSIAVTVDATGTLATSGHPQQGPTTADLTYTGRGRRTETVRLELLDRDGNIITQLTPLSTPNISVDTTRRIPRQLTGLSLPVDDSALIDPYSMRVRPVWSLAGRDWNMGIFCFQQAPRARHTWGLEIDGASLVDLMFQLDQPLWRSWGINAGMRIDTTLTALAADAGITEVAITPVPLTASSPLAWPVGTARSEPVDKLTELISSVAYFDRDGTWTVRPAPDPDTTKPVAVYDDGTVIEADSVNETDDLWEQPNRWIAVSSTSGDTPIVGVYDLPDSAPNSAANRGYVVATKIDADGATSAAAAAQIARQAATSAQVAETVTLSTMVNPAHDMWDVVDYRGVPHLETGWSVDLEVGASMSHTLRRIR